MGWNYLSIPKLQWLHHWSLGMDKQFHPTLYNGCNYLSMLGLKLNRVSKRGYWPDWRIWLSLVQMMVCCLYDTELLFKPMMTCHWCDLIEWKVIIGFGNGLSLTKYSCCHHLDHWWAIIGENHVITGINCTTYLTKMNSLNNLMVIQSGQLSMFYP